MTEALQRAWLSVTVERSADGFVRLTVGDGGATTELDLASDYRLLPAEPSDFGPTLAAEELAIDKVGHQVPGSRIVMAFGSRDTSPATTLASSGTATRTAQAASQGITIGRGAASAL